MFSTYFYILLLVYQLFISDNAGYYNQNVARINSMIEQNDYKNAFIEINKMDNYIIFNNHQLNKLKVLLSIKLNLGMKDLLNDRGLDNYQFPIVLSKMGKKKEALLLLKKNIIQLSNDSLIKLYEIYSINNSFITNKIQANKSSTNFNKAMDNAEALALLDLMKKKEKYLSYKNNVK